MAAVGTATSAAHKYEQLSGGINSRAQAAARGTIKAAFARARETKTPIKAKDLRSAVEKVIIAALDSPLARGSFAPSPTMIAGDRMVYCFGQCYGLNQLT